MNWRPVLPYHLWRAKRMSRAIYVRVNVSRHPINKTLWEKIKKCK